MKIWFLRLVIGALLFFVSLGLILIINMFIVRYTGGDVASYHNSFFITCDSGYPPPTFPVCKPKYWVNISLLGLFLFVSIFLSLKFIKNK